ncbi:NAD(P)-dependent dehydrogenase, short-chain alcohol dehydrogenase family [Halogranum gelatinilyticum]|uniref:NAD(P)-dependent dehydrogenase, short-chain alcohol dehydrogenase family n=1 Tax=Halogranum gelatinilyticum TaxID=660521 RepID=A0A1G9ZBZ2_9EURY|nr:oxidoreductase [Halogranum gelatinilyticum]SDN18970.1 NAD(P)-dependent dehydrogenase, short-chain alcohol dehydrogenase family [Halogranum gelatinilyticum]
MSAPWTVERMPDCSEKTVVVTGANSGLGFEVTRAFAKKGATVVLACRSTERGEDAAQRVRDEVPDADLDVRHLDLANLDSVRSFAEGFLADYDNLDILCNNAGVMATPYRTTEDGFELQFGVNHLGHFALTGHLLPQLAETAAESGSETRVVTTSSGAHRMGEIDFDDLHHQRSYGKWEAYGQSKLANLLFAYELDRRLAVADVDVTSAAAHPGYAATNLQLRGPEMEGADLRERLMGLANNVVAQSAEMGALPILYAATADDVRGGDYIGPDGLAEMRGYPTKVQSTDTSYDMQLADELWAVSEDLTDVSYDFDALAGAAQPAD